jgi:hypothetical protein
MRGLLILILITEVFNSTSLGQVRPLSERLHGSVLPFFRDLEEGEVGSYGIVGDSVSLITSSYNWYLRNYLTDDFGSAGDGYLALARFGGVCTATAGGPRCGLQLVQGPGSVISEDTGPWELPGPPTPDGMWLTLTPTPFPASATVHFFASEAVVHYTRRVGGGPMTIKLNGSLFATVETGLSEGEPIAGRLVIDTGATDPSQLSTLRFETAGPLPVQVNAIEMRSIASGVRYHRLARGGAGPFMFLSSMTPANAEVLRSLDLDLLMVMLDAAAGDGNDDEIEIYESNLATLVDWYRAAMPGVPIVLVTHHPFRPSIEAQADAILRISRERGLGFINLYDLFSGFDEMNDLGYMSGVVHLNPAGGQWFGRYIRDLLTQVGREALIADATGDGRFDFFDVQRFLQEFSTGDADLNGDGVTNFFDVLDFLIAFTRAMES